MYIYIYICIYSRKFRLKQMWQLMKAMKSDDAEMKSDTEQTMKLE